MAIVLLVSLPLVSLFLNSMDGVGEMWEHITTYFLIEYIRNSLVLLIGVSVLTVLIGTSTAWIVTKYEFPFRTYLEWLLFLPLAIPTYIMAYCYQGLFGNGGIIIRSLHQLGIQIDSFDVMNIYGLIWVLSISLFPYVFLAARAIFKSQPASLRDSAELLGASEQKFFFTIAFPLAWPAILGGLFLVLMEVLNDYGAAKYYGINTFTTGIFRTWTALEDLNSAIYLANLLIIMVIFVILISKFLRRNNSFVLKLTHNSDKKRRRIKGSWLASNFYLFIVLCPVLFGVLLPVIQLVYWLTYSFASSFNWELGWISLQSLFIALIASSIVLFASISLVYFPKWNHFRIIVSMSKISTIGYVIPGAIIGISIVAGNHAIVVFFNDMFEWQLGSLLYNSTIILIYAYLFRFLALAYNPIEANSLKIGQHLSNSSHLLGVGQIKTFIKIDFPLLKISLLSAFFVVMVDILKELPLTLLLKPYDVQTLAIKAFEYADDERVADAALPSIILIAMVTLIMILVSRFEQARK